MGSAAGAGRSTGSLRAETADAAGTGVATLVIENPGRRNAVSAAMWGRFAPLLGELAADPAVKVLVVRGAGEDFSAGADITELDLSLGDDRGGGTDGGVMTEAENALAAFPKPTIAAIDGYCVGGGWELAAACDLRIASDRSTFGITPARLGIVYPRSGIERIVAIAGPAVAKHLLFSGELVPAATALGWGLVTKVTPAEGFWAEAYGFAGLLADRSQYSIRAMKEIVDAVAAGRTDVGAVVDRWQATASEDRGIGVEAFLGKRTPEFTWGSGVE
jgi:enoyl-CoA hydratase/carnithine racemase